MRDFVNFLLENIGKPPTYLRINSISAYAKKISKNTTSAINLKHPRSQDMKSGNK